jgi:poly(3-hydroxybutyrate) depolymerase
MLYHLHEMQRMSLMPARFLAEGTKAMLNNPMNPFAQTPAGRVLGSAADLFDHLTQSFGKPAFGLDRTVVDGRPVGVEIEPVVQRAYCHLLHFKRAAERDDPKVLVVAPMSGHYATLLRGTVEALLPDHDVYVTDWQDCRMIPVTADRFNLDDYIDYLIDFLHLLGPNTHMLAVCQPAVPAFAAASIMASWNDACVPATLTLIGGPIDTRQNPTQVNKLAKEHSLAWFEDHVISKVPPPYPGMFRDVLPGFLQLNNFISMNLERHMQSYRELFDHLVRGDDEAAEKKRAFYEEYRAVMDIPAEFYLQTVKTVFQDHALPKGEMIARWHPVRPENIKRTALLCIEGELDDICGVGQTNAALALATRLPDGMKHYHLQKGVGHYGVFNGSKWRAEIAPLIGRFIRTHDHAHGGRPKAVNRNNRKAEVEARPAPAPKPRRAVKRAKPATPPVRGSARGALRPHPDLPGAPLLSRSGGARGPVPAPGTEKDVSRGDRASRGRRRRFRAAHRS